MNIFLCICCLLIAILSKFVFKINYKKAKLLQNNDTLEKTTDKFPENIEVAKDILKMLNNDNVKIEEAKDTKTSLYITVTNKISIADMKNNYARLQTIAHECVHSIQDRRLLITNFIFSNITIIYFVVIALLAIFNVINNISYALIFLLMQLFQYSIRSYLEIDAMTRARYVTEKYIENKKLITEDEKIELLNGYDSINKVGIPFVIDNLFTNVVIKLIVLIVVLILIV